MWEAKRSNTAPKLFKCTNNSRYIIIIILIYCIFSKSSSIINGANNVTIMDLPKFIKKIISRRICCCDTGEPDSSSTISIELTIFLSNQLSSTLNGFLSIAILFRKSLTTECISLKCIRYFLLWE